MNIDFKNKLFAHMSENMKFEDRVFLRTVLIAESSYIFLNDLARRYADFLESKTAKELHEIIKDPYNNGVPAWQPELYKFDDSIHQPDVDLESLPYHLKDNLTFHFKEQDAYLVVRRRIIKVLLRLLRLAAEKAKEIRN
ncbi:hypothetical protein [Taylorella asinigenitalis]|uniref:hypothetical protein n=1 Tax=Taylorella asinigenitalis TaxID=84590 RepID=UPI0005D20D51|nr:hypothetical protein [Taylorella asinigenitalis]